jgi:hypothetical protein
MLHTKFVEKLEIHILFSVTFLKRAVDEIMWKNIEQGSPQMIMWLMRVDAGYLRLQMHPQVV